MQDLSIDIKTMPQAFGGYHLLLVITCNQMNFTIVVPLIYSYPITSFERSRPENT